MTTANRVEGFRDDRRPFYSAGTVQQRKISSAYAPSDRTGLTVFRGWADAAIAGVWENQEFRVLSQTPNDLSCIDSRYAEVEQDEIRYELVHVS